ncbi:MAG TPA: T9SS type A sorting domain-containing protein, partial [Chryseolinea sp.]
LIENNPNLTTLAGLSNLYLIGDDPVSPPPIVPGLVIRHNPMLSNIDALSSLRRALFVSIEDNTSLTTLNGLSSLTEIVGDLRIMSNPSLLEIGGFPSLRSMRGFLQIHGNISLISISGFKTLTTLSAIGIENNPKLVSITGFKSITTLDKKIIVNVYAAGSLAISGNNALTNLQGFSSLKNVSEMYIYVNDQLSNLDDLSSLRSIGSLFLAHNAALSNINALNRIDSIPGTLTIRNNDKLMDLNALSSLTYVGGLSIGENSSLTNINGLSKLKTIGNDQGLSIYDNAVLENVDGLSALTQVNAERPFFAIYFAQNPSLTNCCGLRPLLERLDELYTLDNLVSNGYVKIFENGGDCILTDILNCAGARVSGFSLIDQKTSAVIQHFENEITIDIAARKFANLLLEANTFPQQVGSVEFIFDGIISRTENGSPYQFILPTLSPGTHNVRVEVYSKAQKLGVKGVGRTATFKVINSATVISFDVVSLSRQTLMNLHDGDKINIKDPAFKTFLFRANTTPTFVHKVEFFLNNRRVAVENGSPYELLVSRPPGDYTLEAIPYARIRDNYYPGTSLKINFKLVSEDTDHFGQLVMNDLSNNESLLKAGEIPRVTIFPVPVDRELYVKIDDTTAIEPMITIRTIHGLTVYQDSYSKSQSINTLHLPTGVYYLQVAGNGGFHKVIRFIKK